MRKAYDLAGYNQQRDFTSKDFAKSWKAIKAEVLGRLLTSLEVLGQTRFIRSVDKDGFRFNKREILVVFARSIIVDGEEKWIRVRPKQLRECLQILLRLSADQCTVLDFIVLPLASTNAGIRPFTPPDLPFSDAETCKTVIQVARALVRLVRK